MLNWYRKLSHGAYEAAMFQRKLSFQSDFLLANDLLRIAFYDFTKTAHRMAKIGAWVRQNDAMSKDLDISFSEYKNSDYDMDLCEKVIVQSTAIVKDLNNNFNPINPRLIVAVIPILVNLVPLKINHVKVHFTLWMFEE